MGECGARVPETHGFVCLNSVQKTRPCAALDLQPAEIGTRGVELVVAQLHRNELGIPASPTRTTIPSRWVDGPTVRRAATG
jgi:LacI family transcriptional regulator